MPIFYIPPRQIPVVADSYEQAEKIFRMNETPPTLPQCHCDSQFAWPTHPLQGTLYYTYILQRDRLKNRTAGWLGYY